MASVTGIQALPFEVMILIIHHSHPSSHLPLSLTCKSIYRQLAAVVERHRTAHAKYRSVSDLVPSTIPEMLDVLFGHDDLWNSIDIWHMRCLEFFGVRRRWDDWQPWEIDRPNGCLVPRTSELHNSSDVASNGHPKPLASRPDFRLGEERIEHFLSQAEQRGILPPASIKSARSSTLSGSDAVLKMILISALPNLKVLKYMNADISFGTNIIWLCSSVKWALESGIWPPGLLSLQNLAIGVPLFGGESSMGTSVLVRLLQLPKLVEVYIRNMRIDSEDQQYNVADSDSDDADLFWGEDESERARRKLSRLRLPVHSSSVKHIVLDDMVDYDATGGFMSALMKTPINLESITICAHEEPLAKSSELVRILSQYQSRSLQRLLVYLQYDDLSVGETFAYKPSDLKGLRSLKVLNVRWRDIAMDVPPSAARPHGPISQEDFISYFTEAFPPTMSVLVIYGDCSDGQVWTDGKDETEYLDAAVVALINSGRYPDLEVIYLDKVGLDTPEPTIKARFQLAIDAGRQHGVHVHTALTTGWPENHNAHFVTMPNIQAVKSVPGYDPNWRFDHSNGCHGCYQPCHGCGKCVLCRTADDETP